MKVEEYISSGILEAYAMDQVSDAERSEVEQMAAEHSEIRQEIDRIEKTMEALAFATSVRPKTGIRSKLMDEVSQKVIQMDRSQDGNPILKYAVAASVIVALASAMLAFTYWKKWQSAKGRLSEMITQNARFAENYNQVNLQLDELQNAIAVMNSPSYRRVVMNGTANAPRALATVYWNETTHDVYLSIENLKVLSKDQQYQLWAIIDGKPVDAGVFDLSTDQVLLAMKNIGTGAAAFAVTVEPRGGSENPSLETMQVVGEV